MSDPRELLEEALHNAREDYLDARASMELAEVTVNALRRALDEFNAWAMKSPSIVDPAPTPAAPAEPEGLEEPGDSLAQAEARQQFADLNEWQRGIMLSHLDGVAEGLDYLDGGEFVASVAGVRVTADELAAMVAPNPLVIDPLSDPAFTGHIPDDADHPDADRIEDEPAVSRESEEA